jgi:hypothetical protein
MLHAILVGDAFRCAALHQPCDPDAAFV